ncbi:hypothetical protein RND81_02G249700 [Saponaria officinalis]|uniref:GIR1-like zinc ribbon domain-containing protein n=1 Tax=Saponaria officinalis TaxID=3572 RepID=A0AAW1MWL0_SAPOF
MFDALPQPPHLLFLSQTKQPFSLSLSLSVFEFVVEEMETATAWLERSFQNCSLNHSPNSPFPESSSSSSSHLIINNNNNNKPAPVSSEASSSDDNSRLIELHSHVALPYHWEQCLDLQSGEVYYINWSTGMKAKQDPRTLTTGYSGDYYSEEEDGDDEEGNPYDEDDSEESTTESSSCSSFRSGKSKVRQQQQRRQEQHQVREEAVLVVAGCKRCLMYYMLPKQLHHCPKCCGQLLHFAAPTH